MIQQIDGDGLEMIIERATGLGLSALENPMTYKGFMGVSILHKFYSKKRMYYYFKWASQLFKEFAIILMDDPDQYNFMVFSNMDKLDALAKAREISDEIKRSYERELTKLGIKNIKVIQFRDFKENKAFKKLVKATYEFMEKNTSFKEDLYSLIEVGIGGKIIEYQKNNHLNEEKIIDVHTQLSAYIIEELASIIYFTETGYQIEVDPTKEFSTKKYLYAKKFKKMDEYFTITERGHIYAHPRGITKSSY